MLINSVNPDDLPHYAAFHLGLHYLKSTYIPNKKRNVPLRAVQPSGRSQVINQFSLYQCKGMSGTAALHVYAIKLGTCVKENWPRTKWGVKL